MMKNEHYYEKKCPYHPKYCKVKRGQCAHEKCDLYKLSKKPYELLKKMQEEHKWISTHPTAGKEEVKDKIMGLKVLYQNFCETINKTDPFLKMRKITQYQILKTVTKGLKKNLKNKEQSFSPQYTKTKS